MSVLELFDDTTGRSGTSVMGAVYDAVTGMNATKVVSSFVPTPLRVLGQSYYLSPSLKTIGVTQTARGITQKQVLLGTTNEQVISLDKRWLDPRRPTKPTTVDRDEGLLPYSENLPIFPQSYLSTDKQIARLKKIISSPASLESSSLVFAFGLDIFYTRTMPNKTYDLLGDEFSYGLLVVTITVLLGGALALAYLVRQKELERKWR